MTKLSELIADPNTNLTAVAAGDYVIIYDVSEPLDTRKVKVIPISDFSKSINPPSVIARVGASATDWNSPFGNTIYATPNAKMQLIVGYVEFPTSSDLWASKTFTFPYAFDGVPVVIPFFISSPAAGMTIEAISLTKTGCLIQARKYAGSGVLAYSVGGLAIGDIA